MANAISTIERHPNRQAIINKILAGLQLKDIAAEYNVSPQALGRFRRNTLRKIVLSPKAAQSASVTPQTVSQLTQLKSNLNTSIAAMSTAAMVERKLGRYDRLLGKAEMDNDLRSWASIDRSETAALQLRAQLAGELQQQAQSNIQVAILIPPPVAGSPQWGEDGPTIEVDARQGGLACASDGGEETGE